jgi:peptide deformylase
MVREILKLGNPQLYDMSEEITEADLDSLSEWVQDLHDTLMDYRERYGAGRAVAAPQIGIKKRLL